MNINLNSFSSHALSFFQQNLLRSLNQQHKKILLIASFAFGCLAACYLVSRYTFKAKKEIIIMEGTLIDGKLSGQGKMSYREGVVGYVDEGEFKEGQLTGLGKRSYSNGKVLDGEFKKGQFTGHGKITFAHGDEEEGDFIDGQLNGQGKITFVNGGIWEGEFKEGDIKWSRKDDFSHKRYERRIQKK